VAQQHGAKQTLTQQNTVNTPLVSLAKASTPVVPSNPQIKAEKQTRVASQSMHQSAGQAKAVKPQNRPAATHLAALAHTQSHPKANAKPQVHSSQPQIH
jgi:hypothetical protein